MEMIKRFELIEEHIELLQQLNFTYDDDTEYGAPEVNPKRPYGNSDVDEDIAVIIGLRTDYEHTQTKQLTTKELELIHKLHLEMETVLQIVTRTLSFKPGIYEADYYTNNWEFIPKINTTNIRSL
jgi:hypothetical protein